MRKCGPLWDGDTHRTCGVMFDDAKRSTICPHVSLAGGDTVGIGPFRRTTAVDAEVEADAEGESEE